ncbi:MAG: hypothetical protein Q9163_002257 [Psora crenata]
MFAPYGPRVPDMPTMATPCTEDAGSKSQMVFNNKFEFLHSQSITNNFANMIAQSDQKPSKPVKAKTKKPPEQHRDIYTVRVERPLPPPSFVVPNPAQILPSQPQSFQQPVANDIAQDRSSAPSHNPWQIQWDDMNQTVQAPTEPIEDTRSEDMEISSGSEADDMSLDGSPHENTSRQPATETLQFPDSPRSRKGNYLSDCMDTSSGPEADYESDDPSVSRVASTTPFNGSGASSHTSSAVFSNDIRISIEDSKTSYSILKPPSPSSEVSSQLSPAKSITPAALKPSNEPSRSAPRRKMPRVKKVDFAEQRPRTAIPVHLAAATVAQQGIHAAYASRLSPFALHHQEYQLLRHHICHLHVTAYLNIRNRILRLWVRNPLVHVTAEEAAGCAQASRWLGLAKVAYEWLVRKGYINFGCLEIPDPPDLRVKRYKLKRAKKKTIAVIGAGMAGLGCARQLEGLIKHYREKWAAAGEDPPSIILLEGRNRIGGRIYSHPLKDQRSSLIPEKTRCTAEMGAHIIIGFDHGNPMSMIVRGQLALHYHTLKDNSSLHDTDGTVVKKRRDGMVEALYNDCLDRASAYRNRIQQPLTVEGDREMIESGRDPQRPGGPPISAVEAETPNIPAAFSNEGTENVPRGMDKLTGKAHMSSGPRKKEPPAVAAEAMGWRLGENVLSYDDLNLDAVAKSSKHPTLGAVMDEAVKQYQFLLDLTPQDMRLINWHYANLEYANAAIVGKLSLGGWDQDAGNEFEGPHAQIIGGYQQVPRAILQLPSRLDLRTRKTVKRIEYNIWSGNSKAAGAKIHCESGETLEADHVVLTSPLGVLKDRAIEFVPPLPDWKLGPINRLGFGILNKCVLVYEKPFWDVDQDMFGLLREPEVKDSLDQEDYVTNRGRFYFFWNCIKTSGRPVLISLMAGDAAHQVESASDVELVAEVTQELSKIFKEKQVPPPQESIITRWGKDRFARGTYSYVGPEALPGDYDVMAMRVGNLHFAGEATCATHPATVHGAYLSGLRAASEIIDDLLGPIEIPNPLVRWPTDGNTESYETPPQGGQSQAQKLEQVPSPMPTELEETRTARLEAFEGEILDAIHKELGFRPSPPRNPRSNAFLLYTTDNWRAVKASVEAERLADASHPLPKSEAKDIRTIIGAKWGALSDEEKRPYREKAEAAKLANQMTALTYDHRLREWDRKAVEMRRKFIDEHPGVMSKEEEDNMWKALEVYGDFDQPDRKAKRASGYADMRDEDSTMSVQ